MHVGISVPIAKRSATGRYVSGWASVVKRGGDYAVHHGGDVVLMKALRNAAHDFISDQRVAKVQHNGKQIGQIVEAVIVDDDFAKAMGATVQDRGLWIKMRVDDPDTRALVLKGKLPMFSVGGRGGVVDLEDIAYENADFEALEDEDA